MLVSKYTQNFKKKNSIFFEYYEVLPKSSTETLFQKNTFHLFFIALSPLKIEINICYSKNMSVPQYTWNFKKKNSILSMYYEVLLAGNIGTRQVILSLFKYTTFMANFGLLVD